MSSLDLHEVSKFLQGTAPFDRLEAGDLRRLLQSLDVMYLRQGEHVIIDDAIDESEHSQSHIGRGLYIVRRGAFRINSHDGTLVDKIADGECFGLFSMLENPLNQFVVTALEDSLVFCCDKKSYLDIANHNPELAEFFALTRVKRMDKWSASRFHKAQDSAGIKGVNTQHKPTDNGSLSLPITHVMSDHLITTSQETSIQEAARQMSESRVSSIMVVDQGQLIGIVTDRDLRSRVLAKGLSPSEPIVRVMSREPTSLDSGALSIHAKLLMSEKNIHHLPIVNRQNMPVGMVTITDILRHQQVSPLLMVSHISRKQTVEELAEVCAHLPQLVINLILAELSPSDMGEVLAAITDNLTRRLIMLAIEELGVPPMEFNFLVFGSQARKDQSLGSDQDNGLMLERNPTIEESYYFQRLARFVCDGLDQCGVPYCPGNIMCTNESWCLSRERWQQTFNRWVSSSSPQSLLNASIFFDLRSLYGPSEPVEALGQLIQERASQHSIFLATLTRNAVASRPPLGFFRDFVVEHSGEHKNKLNLKHQALALINDLARIYGFATKRYQHTTLDRLQCIADEGLLSEEVVSSLHDAWEYLSELRLYTQQASWQAHGRPSAYLDPSSLSPLERKHLKLTFKTILEVQEFAQHSFAKGLSLCLARRRANDATTRTNLAPSKRLFTNALKGECLLV